MKQATRTRIILALVALALLGIGPRIHVAYLASLVLVESVTPDADGPIARLRPNPEVQIVTFEAGEKLIVADLYRPNDGRRHPGIVLNHGVADRGKNDPRLVNFADALARAGYVALVPEFTNLKEFRVRPSDVDELVASFEYLERSEYVQPDRIGLFGLSYAGGLAVLAAGDPRIADRVRFCFVLGGYYDLRDVVVFVTTGRYRTDRGWAYLEPTGSGRWAFLLSSADLIEDPEDRELLARIARKKLADPEADVDRYVGVLGEEGLRVYAIMVGENPDQVAALLDELGDRAQSYLEELSPAGRLDRVRCRLIIAHGRDDNLIPYTQSILLAENAPPGTDVRLTILDSFQHVDLSLHRGRGATGFVSSLAELWRLFSVTYGLLAEGLL